MKKILTFLLLFLLAPLFVFASEFDITGEYVVLYNLNDDEILYEQNSNEQTSIASITKIMTALVAMDNISDYDSIITITTADFEGTTGYSKAGFSVGDRVTYRDLLYGILLPSGADAVNAIVRNTLGYDSFIIAMNELAKKIGLENTSFSNPVGKDDVNNYSTASDVAKMLKYALENPLFKEIFTTKEYTTTNGINLESTLYPYQDILDIDKIAGSKSGFTRGAGRCLASITNLDGVNYLLVILNSSVDQNYSAVLDTITIYDYYNDNFSYQDILTEGQLITTIPVKWGKDKTYEITSPISVSKFLENSASSNLTYEYNGLEEIPQYTKKDTKLGTISVYNGGKLLYETTVTLTEDISYYHPVLWLISGFVILVVLILLLKKRKRRRKRK